MKMGIVLFCLVEGLGLSAGLAWAAHPADSGSDSSCINRYAPPQTVEEWARTADGVVGATESCGPDGRLVGYSCKHSEALRYIQQINACAKSSRANHEPGAEYWLARVATPTRPTATPLGGCFAICMK